MEVKDFLHKYQDAETSIVMIVVKQFLLWFYYYLWKKILLNDIFMLCYLVFTCQRFIS